MNKAQKIVAVSMTAVGLLYVAYGAGFFINTTPSLPVGVYFKDKKSVKKDNTVMFCLTDKSIPAVKLAYDRNYFIGSGGCFDGKFHEQKMLMKPVVAMSGDTVIFNENGVYVNNVLIPNSKPLSKDSKNRTLPHYPYGSYVVENDLLWVISSYNKKSFDSRYYGPITTYSIRYNAKPIFTWNSA